MTTSYEGEAENVSLLAPRAIASSTNATPIEITTSVAHGYLDGELVEIKGHETNVNANNYWKIVLVSATKFTLTGSVGSAVGGATGFANAPAPRPNLALPDGAALPSMSTFNPSIETQEDKIASLSARIGTYGVKTLEAIAHTDDSFAVWSEDITGAANVWTENKKDASSVVGHGFTELAANVVMDVAHDNLDTIDVKFSTTLSAFAGTTDFALFLLVEDYGVAPLFSNATQIVGSAQRFPNNYFGPLILHGRRLLSGSAHGKYAQVYLAAKNAGTLGYELSGHAQILITQYRNGQVLP